MNKMLTETKWKILLDLINSSSKEELIWINGYLSGLVAQGNLKQDQPTAKPAVGKITIAYGTETGNSKKLATDFAAKAKQNHVHAKVIGMDQYRLTDLTKEEYL